MDSQSKFLNLNPIYIQEVLKFFDIHHRKGFHKKLLNKRLHSIDWNALEKIYNSKIEKGQPICNKKYPYNQIGHVQIIDSLKESIFDIGNGILIDDDETIVVPIDHSNYQENINDKFLFIYENQFLFATKLDRASNFIEISRKMYSKILICEEFSENQFLVLKLENKLVKKLKNRPFIPDNILTSIASKKGYMFKTKIISLNFQQNFMKHHFIEATSIAKIKDNYKLIIEKFPGYQKISNGASLYISWNDKDVLIGQIVKNHNNRQVHNEKLKGFVVSNVFKAPEKNYIEEIVNRRVSNTITTKSSSNLIEIKKNPFVRLGSNDANESHYNYEEKLDGENIIYKFSESKFRIYYMSIDLYLTNIVNSKVGVEKEIDEYFLLQFHTFLSQEIFMNKILSLFEYFTVSLNIFPFNIILFINKWIFLKWCENSIPNEVRTQIQNFYTNLENYEESDSEILMINKIKEIIIQENQLDCEFMISRLRRKPNPQNLMSKNQSLLPTIRLNYFDILIWPEIEIARQLTIYTHQYFSKIGINELLLAKWTKKTKFQESPNIMKCIDRFNNIALWVCEEVLSYDKKKTRAAVIEKFINIANECKKIRNFNDCLNIITGLSSLALKFLKKSWKHVSSESIRLFSELSKFVTFEDNYKNLFLEIKKSKGFPYVPYLGLYLKELAYIEEGPKYVKGVLINFDKIRQIGEIIDEFTFFKKKSYLFKIVDQLSFLNNIKSRTEDELIELSDKLEPKFILYKQKSISKRLSTNDLLEFEKKE